MKCLRSEDSAILELFSRECRTESKSHLLWFFVNTLTDWFKNARQFHIQSEEKPKPIVRDSLTHVFPRFLPATCFCFEF